jgi:hypothetical protein
MIESLPELPNWAPYAIMMVLVGAVFVASKAKSASEALVSESRGSKVKAIASMGVVGFAGGFVIGLRYPPARIAGIVWRAIWDALPLLSGVGL